MLRQGGCGWEKDLQFFATCPIYLPQLPKLVSLVHVLGQPAHPEVVNQRPILGYVGCSPHGYCTLTGLTKPWPIMQSCAARLGWCSPCGSNGCTSRKVSWWANHGPAHTMYMASCPMAVHGPSKQGSFTPAKGLPQTKGTTGDLVSHAHGLVCWTRQPFIHISNLAKPHHSFAPSFPQT